MGIKPQFQRRRSHKKTNHLQPILVVHQMNSRKFVMILHNVANAKSCGHPLSDSAQLTKSAVLYSTDQQTIFILKRYSFLLDFPPKAHTGN